MLTDRQIAALGGALVFAVGIQMLPYWLGQGHHPAGGAALKGDPSCNYRGAPAIPKETLEEAGGGTVEGGRILHQIISRAERFLFDDFRATGQRLTWNALRRIETDAMVAAGFDYATARATVNAAIADAIKAGMLESNLRIPGGP